MNNHKNIFFSICIPQYHYEKYVEDAVKSVYDNNYDNFEIVICDQGDTDSSFLLKKYNKVRIIHLDEPSTYNARARLINEVNGEYFIQLDADDYLDKNALSSLNKVILDSKEKDVYIFRKRDLPFDLEKEQCDGSYSILSKEEMFNLVYCSKEKYYSYNDMNSKCLKRVSSFKYEEKKMCNNEDGYIYLELLSHYSSYVFHNRINYFLRKHDDSASKLKNIKKLSNQSTYFVFLFGRLNKKYTIKAMRSNLYEFYNNYYFAFTNGEFNSKYWKHITKDKEIRKFLKIIRLHIFYYFRKIDIKKYLILMAINKKIFYKFIFKFVTKNK